MESTLRYVAFGGEISLVLENGDERVEQAYEANVGSMTSHSFRIC